MGHSTTLSVGLEVHQASIAVAYASEEPGAAVVLRGPIGTRQCDRDPLGRKLHSKATPLLFVDEAGPCGDWFSRDLTKKPRVCWVGAPSRTPKKAGDGVTTDRREAVQRARLMRSGELPPVDVPAVEDEALRDRSRAREDAIRDRKAAKNRLKAFLRRPESRDESRATWGPAPLRGLSEVVCPTPAQPMVFHEYGWAVSEPHERLHRLEAERHDHVQAWCLSPVVQALQARRGIQCTVAVTLIAALGDLTRFDNPRPLMSERGLPPVRTPVAHAVARAPSPQPATPVPAEPASRGRGPPGIQPRSAALCTCAWRRYPRPSSTAVGRPRDA